MTRRDVQAAGETSARIERWVVDLIALHSLGVGLALALLGRWGLELGGWLEVSTLFFARQAGVFHIVVALGYFFEYRKYGSVYLMLIAKSAAVLFLVSMMLLGDAPWSVPVSALGDGAMLVVALLLHQRTRRGDV